MAKTSPKRDTISEASAATPKPTTTVAARKSTEFTLADLKAAIAAHAAERGVDKNTIDPAKFQREHKFPVPVRRYRVSAVGKFKDQQVEDTVVVATDSAAAIASVIKSQRIAQPHVYRFTTTEVKA